MLMSMLLWIKFEVNVDEDLVVYVDEEVDVDINEDVSALVNVDVYVYDN